MTTETIINIDHTNNEIHCYSCHSPTMAFWKKNYPDLISEDNGYSMTLKPLPKKEFQKFTLRKKRVLTEEQKEVLRKRAQSLHQKPIDDFEDEEDNVEDEAEE